MKPIVVTADRAMTVRAVKARGRRSGTVVTFDLLVTQAMKRGDTLTVTPRGPTPEDDYEVIELISTESVESVGAHMMTLAELDTWLDS